MADVFSFGGVLLGILEGFILWFLEYLPKSRGTYQFVSESFASAWGHPEVAEGLEVLIVIGLGIGIWNSLGNFAKGIWKFAALFGILVAIALLAYLVGVRP